MAILGKAFDPDDGCNTGSTLASPLCNTTGTSGIVNGCKSGDSGSKYIRPTVSDEIILRIHKHMVVDLVQIVQNKPGTSFHGFNPLVPEVFTYSAALIIPPGDYVMGSTGGDDDQNNLKFQVDIEVSAATYKNLPFTTDGDFINITGDPNNFQVGNFTNSSYRIDFKGDTGGGSELGFNPIVCTGFIPGDPATKYNYTIEGRIHTHNYSSTESFLGVSTLTMTYTLDIIQNELANQNCGPSSVRNYPTNDVTIFKADTVKHQEQVSSITTPAGDGNPGKIKNNTCASCYYWCWTSGQLTKSHLPIINGLTPSSALSGLASQYSILFTNPVFGD